MQVKFWPEDRVYFFDSCYIIRKPAS